MASLAFSKAPQWAVVFAGLIKICDGLKCYTEVKLKYEYYSLNP